MSGFSAVVSIGFDKNGEADFRVSMALADFTPEKMNDLRRMIPVAIAETERCWIQHGPPSREMAMCSAAERVADS